MEPPKFEQLVERADRRAIYINQVKHAKETFRARNVLFWEGHRFELTQEFMSYIMIRYVSWLADASSYPPKQPEDADPIIFLDKNDEPVLISDMNKFVAEVEDVHASALNEYYDTYSRLQYAQSTEELIEVG